MPDPALSTGYGQAFAGRGRGCWGDEPYTDLMAATDAAVARPDIGRRPDRGHGGSFGGYMATGWPATPIGSAAGDPRQPVGRLARMYGHHRLRRLGAT